MLRVLSNKYHVVRDDAAHSSKGSLYVPLGLLQRCLLQIEVYGTNDDEAHVFLWHPSTRDPNKLPSPRYPCPGWQEALRVAGFTPELDYSVLDTDHAIGGGYPSSVMTTEELDELALKVRRLRREFDDGPVTYKRVIVTNLTQ